MKFNNNLRNNKNLLHWPINASRADHANVRYTLTSVFSKNDKVGDVLNADAVR